MRKMLDETSRRWHVPEPELLPVRQRGHSGYHKHGNEHNLHNDGQRFGFVYNHDGGSEMTFGDALEQSKAGKEIRRNGWPHDAVACAAYSHSMKPYLVRKERGYSDAMPYVPTDGDLFADDWEVM